MKFSFITGSELEDVLVTSQSTVLFIHEDIHEFVRSFISLRLDKAGNVAACAHLVLARKYACFFAWC